MKMSLLRTHTSRCRCVPWKRWPPRRRSKSWCPARSTAGTMILPHSPMFQQVEGLLMDRHITFADLKGNPDAVLPGDVRLQCASAPRPSFFPFTEPSAEMDIYLCDVRRLSCQGVLAHRMAGDPGGSGIVHPNVLRYGGYDPSRLPALLSAGGRAHRHAQVRHQ